MSIRKLSLMAVVVVAAVCLSLRAEDAAKEKPVDRLFRVMRVEQMMSGSIGTMLDAQVKANPQLAKARPAMEKFFAKYMSWASMKGDISKAYTDAFTDEELTKLSDFYETPLGQKVVTEMPGLMAKGAEIGQSRVRDHIPELQQMIVAEMAKPQEAPATQPDKTVQ